MFYFGKYNFKTKKKKKRKPYCIEQLNNNLFVYVILYTFVSYTYILPNYYYTDISIIDILFYRRIFISFQLILQVMF